MLNVDDIIEQKNKRKARLEEALHSITAQLKAMGALKIVLFGSLAENQVDVHSDLDVLVIMPSSKSTKEWMGIIYECVERGVASEIIVWNESDFAQHLPRSRFLQHIVQGKVVYEKTQS